MSKEGIDLVQSLMAPEPLDRLSANQALRHPWMATGDDTKSLADQLASILLDSAMFHKPDFPENDEITQPAVQWTTDVEDIDSLSFAAIRDIPEQVNQRDQEEDANPASDFPQHDTTKTVPSPKRPGFQTYIEDADEDSNPIEGTAKYAPKAPPAPPEEVVDRKPPESTGARDKHYWLRKQGRQYFLQDAYRMGQSPLAPDHTDSIESIKVLEDNTYIPTHCVSLRAVVDLRYDFVEHVCLSFLRCSYLISSIASWRFLC